MRKPPDPRQPDMFSSSSRSLADQGITRAVEHADREVDGWSDRALMHLRLFAEIRPSFLGEDVRAWAYDQGLPRPPKECAWGAVMLRGARENIIARDGYGTTKIPPQHAKPAVQWRSLVQLREAA